ncbi:MAG: FtsX-like permease family protein [Cellulosilyticum sp.]|nr:FtsX-like permease family protein [Cellulosilyticum sp.]
MGWKVGGIGVENDLWSMGQSYWRKKARMIIGLLAVQMTIIIFILSVGCSLLDGIVYGIGFGHDRCAIISPKGQKMEEAKALFEKHDKVVEVMVGAYQHVNSKVIFSALGGTPFIKLKPEDLLTLMDEYGVKLIKGDMPQNENEVLVTIQGLFMAEGEIGGYIGEGQGDNALGLNGTYKVSGLIQTDYNMVLGRTNQKETLFVLVEDKIDDEVMTFISKHQALYERRFGAIDVAHLIEQIRENLGILMTCMLILLYIQLRSTVGSLLNAYLNQRLGEIALLHILGYSKREITKRLMKAYGWMIGIGGILGILGGHICLILFYYMYCQTRAVYYTLWHPLYWIVPVAMLSLLLSVSLRKSYKKLKNVEWTDILKS